MRATERGKSFFCFKPYKKVASGTQFDSLENGENFGDIHPSNDKRRVNTSYHTLVEFTKGMTTRENSQVTCCWGSMMRGHRLQLVMTDPFSSDIRSAGRPSLVIWALFPSFVKRSRGSTPGVRGILRSSISACGRKGLREYDFTTVYA